LQATNIDFSLSSCQNFALLSRFSLLHTLVVDKVGLVSLEGFPTLPTLCFLSLSGNTIRVLHRMLKALQKKCPVLTHLTLLGNPCCPDPLGSSGSTDDSAGALRQEAYERHRMHMSMALPNLLVLDGRITDAAAEQPRPWYAGDAARMDCRAAVLSAMEGDFLIREGAASGGAGAGAGAAVGPPSFYEMFVKSVGSVAMATFRIVLDSKGRYTIGGSTHGSLEDLVFAIGPKMLQDPVGGAQLMLGNAVIVNSQGGYSEAVYGDDDESFYHGSGGAGGVVPASPVPVFVSSSLRGGDTSSSSSSNTPPAGSPHAARPLPAVPPVMTGGGGGGALYDARTMPSASSSPAPSSSTPQHKEDVYATPNRETFTVEIRRPDLRTSYGFSLGENAAGAKFITGVVSGGLSDAKLQLGDTIVSLNGKTAADMSHADVIATVVSGCQLLLRLRRASTEAIAASASIPLWEPPSLALALARVLSPPCQFQPNC
jgi:hypothetical protein